MLRGLAAGAVRAVLLLPELLPRAVRGGRVGAVPALHGLRPVSALLPVAVGVDGPDPRLQAYNALLGPFIQYTVVQILVLFNLAFKGLISSTDPSSP